MKPILVLGSTGSIGTQTLDVVRAHPGAFEVVGLAANRSWKPLLEQVREFRPRFAALSDPEAAERLRPELPEGTALLSGPDAVEELAAEADYHTAVHGVVGAAGLMASVRILERDRTLALANKESLVIAGDLLMGLVREGRGRILPVDSELCAIHQCLVGESVDRVRTIHLTASGGPFRDLPLDEFAAVTPARALRHPTWEMGPRITIGSATLMNKALEVIEVHQLFGVPREKIHVVIHRQSVVHSMVEFVDGSVMAQLGPPDMRGPLHYCLHHPDRVEAPLRGFDPQLFASLTFEEVDPRRFPALELGFRCVEEGRDSGCALNAADEVAVEAFLADRIAFPDIVRVNETVLGRRAGAPQTVDALQRADALARDQAREEVAALASV